MAQHTVKVTAPAGVCSRGSGLAQTGCWQLRLGDVAGRLPRGGDRITDPGELRAWQGRARCAWG